MHNEPNFLSLISKSKPPVKVGDIFYGENGAKCEITDVYSDCFKFNVCKEHPNMKKKFDGRYMSFAYWQQNMDFSKQGHFPTLKPTSQRK
jgi:hypothetical protein